MKILPVEKIREADAYTIQNEPVSSVDLMERAAFGCFQWIRERFDLFHPFYIFCGPGNNGGDGLVIARYLANSGYTVRVFVVGESDRFSDDFMVNFERLKQIQSITIEKISDSFNVPSLPEKCVMVDALFGSGLTRPVSGLFADVIRLINNSGCKIISIDIPSGLFADSYSADRDAAIVQANYTLTFEFPKLAFFFPENARFVGEWHIIPIGLLKEYTDRVDVKNYTIESDDVARHLIRRGKFSHKGHFGHGLLIAGGYGKMGAAVLAARAAMRSGAGLITAHIPASGYPIMQTAAPEVMVSIDSHELYFSRHPDLTLYNAIAVGPGLGTNEKTQIALKLLIQNSALPIIFDADALNILALNKTWLSFLPPLSILTPHPKEFERLFGKTSNDFERNRLQREFSVMHKVYIILKGAYTCISTPDGKCFFNTSGNPGMATGGSGDVLTGIILGLMAQGYHPREAAIIGVHLHGLAGDIAVEHFGLEALIAGDIINYIGEAYKHLHTLTH